MSQRFPPTQRFYTELREDDVLLGRGTGPNDFEGNIRYRKMVKAAIAGVPLEVFSASKAALSRKIVDEITDKGGRFVRKLSTEEAAELHECLRDGIHKTELAHIIAQKKPIYIEVAREVAIEKTKQGFRHQTRSKPSPAGSGESKIHLRTRIQPNPEGYVTTTESYEGQRHHPLAPTPPSSFVHFPSILTGVPTIAAPVYVPPTLTANVATNSSALQQALLLPGQGARLQPQTVPLATRLPGVTSNQLGGLPPHLYQLLLQQQSLPNQQPSLLALQLTLASLRQQEQTQQQQHQTMNLAAMLLTGGQRSMAFTQLAQQLNQLQNASASSTDDCLKPPALAANSSAPAAASSTHKIDPALHSANLLLQEQARDRGVVPSQSPLAPPEPRCEDGTTDSGSCTEDDEDCRDTKPRASSTTVSNEPERNSNDTNERPSGTMQKTRSKPGPLKKRRKS